MSYERYTTQDEVRHAFWLEHPQFREHKGKAHNDCPTDVRVAFVDFINNLYMSGDISPALAQRVTL